MEQLPIDQSEVSSIVKDDDEIDHSCSYCQKIVLNLDYDFDMAEEDGEFVNILLQATLDDIMEALKYGCDFAKQLEIDSTLRTNSNSHWILCARVEDHKT